MIPDGSSDEVAETISAGRVLLRRRWPVLGAETLVAKALTRVSRSGLMIGLAKGVHLALC